jgi:GWxTD domain-containing protein
VVMSRAGYVSRFFLLVCVFSVLSFAAAFAQSAPGDSQAKPAADQTKDQAKDETKDQAKDQAQPAAQSGNSSAKPATKMDPAQDQSGDPLKRPISEKRKKENARSMKHELKGEYKSWLDQDVRWIISDEERKAFMNLSNDEERDKFIEAFWDRRNPNPDSEDNEFKDEHYRRIEYANEHFAAGVQGWRTDRGRIYIVFGPADEVESHPSGGTYQRPMEEGGGETSTYPFEDWRYRHIDGIGEQVIVEFVDTCMCGEYHMTMDRGEKDALAQVPGAGLTMYEQMGMSTKADRLTGGGLERLGAGPNSQSLQAKEFDRLEQFAKLNQAPPIKFKDLAEEVGHRITYNPMPFDVRADFVKITNETVLVPVTVQIRNRDITFVNKDGVQHGVVNIFGRLTSIGGKVAQTFEETVQADVPAELLAREAENYKIYWKAVPLRPGRYKLDVVLKDVNGDRMGTFSRGIVVPDYSDDKLSSSTLILADQVEPVPTNSVGSGMFVIGTTKVRPRVAPAEGKPAVFKRGQKVNFWMQVYNLSVDEKTHKPSATFEYDIVNATTNKAVVHAVDSSEKMGNLGDQVTLQKAVASANLDPGVYRIQIKVNDNISKQTVDPSATFAVE